jgi:hypothetical protein
MRESTRNKLEKVNKFIVEGMTTAEACEKASVPLATYYKNKHQLKDRVEIKTTGLFTVPVISDASTNDKVLITKLQAENNELRRFIKNFL